MFQNLYPDEDADSAYEIDYQSYYDRGYRGILFDVDNTLVEHDQPVTIVAIALFQKLKEIGFKTCIISNNKDERVKPLADALESDYVYKAGKPSAKGYLKGMEQMGLSPSKRRTVICPAPAVAVTLLFFFHNLIIRLLHLLEFLRCSGFIGVVHIGVRMISAA